MLKIGDKAPAFTLPGTDGSTHALSDQKGKFVVVYFYPKDNTPGCTAEACDFRDNMASLQQSNTLVYGISKDSLESHHGFIEKQGLNFVLLSDTDMSVHRAFGAVKADDETKTQRATFLIDPQGFIAAQWNPVTVEGHVEAVLKRLKELA